MNCTGRDHLEGVLGFSRTLLHVPSPFGDLGLCLFVVINCHHEYHSSSESSESSEQTTKPEGGLRQQRTMKVSLKKKIYDLGGYSGKGFPREVLFEVRCEG